MLGPLLEEIQVLKLSFNVFSVCHIYRKRNVIADRIYKEGLQQDLGRWKVA